MMRYSIFNFEIQYRLKRADTYIFFVFLFLFSLAAVDFVFQGIDLGAVKMNAPIVIAKAMAATTGILMIIASLVMGVPVLRDFEYNMESLLFINPIKKYEYLLGKFLGSLVILVFIFSGMLWGFVLSEAMPWRHGDELVQFNFLTYAQPFITIVLPILFFGAVLFFVSGALSKKLLVVYTQGIVFLVVFMLTKAITHEFLQAVLDPLSLTTLTDMVEFWSTDELNIKQIPFEGVLFYNKIFWFIFSLVLLGFGYYKFNFNTDSSKKTKTKTKNTKALPVHCTTETISKQSLRVTIHKNFASQCLQLIHFSWFYFLSICKQVSFWTIVLSGSVIILINSISLGTVYGVDSHPKTYFIVGELQEMSAYFFSIILIFYSGELIWKERGAKFNLICDATIVSDFTILLSKFFGLVLVYIVLILSLILSGIVFQASNGYYHYELDIYFYGFFLEIFPFLVLYTIISFFFHALCNHKFLGFILVLTFIILNVALKFLGVDHGLVSFGGGGLQTYSDMNGYGQTLEPYLWIKLYWLVFTLLLLLTASIISARGTETSFKKRVKLSKQKISSSKMILGGSMLTMMVLIGSYIFYNTNIINDYWSSSEKLEYRVNYEKKLKKFEYLPQPKITDVYLEIELYPKTSSYTTMGSFMLTNTQKEAIDQIHIQKRIESNISLEDINFEGGATLDKSYQQFDYHVFRLNKPLQPGDAVKMKFKQIYSSKGFQESHSNTGVLNNGTFFTNKELPTLGYNQKYEVSNDRDRETYGLGPKARMAKPSHPDEITFARSGGDANLINFEVIIGTDLDQKAVAPGDLQRTWIKNNRSYFHYKANEPIINFYSIVSARYELIRDTWTPKSNTMDACVALEIYYHKGHEYNLDRMMEAMKMSFDYFDTNFSPYQYNQMRILEVPRYQEYAQSFPNTVPFSEAIGFVLDINDETDVDMVFYITAHELAHQWWGMQVEAANVQGQLMILETLAQYAALMVLKQKYSEEKIKQFLQDELERYTLGKKKESDKEVPLQFVEKQEYIYYNKGSLAMHTLQTYIGEEKVNLALNRFINDWNSQTGKLKTRTKRYATTKDLLSYFKEVTPDTLQYSIKDLFQTVPTSDFQFVPDSND